MMKMDKRFSVTKITGGFIVRMEFVTSWECGWDEGKDQEVDDYACKTFEEVLEKLEDWKIKIGH